MSKRAALYARVSTDDQRGNYSIPTQLAEQLRRVQERGYGLVGDRYVDRESGRDCSPGPSAVAAFVDDYTSREISRPGLDAALAFAETAGFDVLVVHALDRMARDPYIRRTLEIEFERRGVKIEYVLGNYDETPEGEVRKDLDATFGKWENAKRVERSTRGKIGKAKAGKWVTGRIPYGYRSDKAAPAGLAIDANEAETVRHIFHLYANDLLSEREVARSLTADGILPQQAKRVGTAMPWAQNSIEKILRNRAYIGFLYYNRHKFSGDKLVAERDRTEWVEIKIMPIVEEAIFQRAQEVTADNRARRRRRASRFYLLRGMIVCSECGKGYTAQTNPAIPGRQLHDIQYYRHATDFGHCCNRYLWARDIEPAVWEAIVKLLLDPASLRQGYEESLSHYHAEQERERHHLETLRRAAKAIEQKRENLNAAYIDPEIHLSKVEYIAQRASLERELADILEDIERIEADLAKVPTPADIETVETFADEIREVLRAGTLAPEEKRKVLQMLHVKIVVKPDGTKRLDGWLSPQGLMSPVWSSW